ncbi:MAG: sugar phosphate nucleotidyltransferase [Deltaproteobacteria bacterium]|nr:sugar phosphate nucleotidyltransferase [Deltaproteobacteria bacterium]
MKAKKQLKKAIIPVAGMGTRVQEMTHGLPKEMLSIGGKPMIFYAIQEAALSGLEELYIVINEHKTALRKYLESADLARAIGSSLPCLTFIEQPLPLGSGEAIYRARALIGEEPFALMMPDFVLFGDTPALRQLILLHEQCGCDIVGLLPLLGKEAEGFGNVGIVQGQEQESGAVAIHSLSDKMPTPLIVREEEQVLKAVPYWILGPHFFDYLERTKATDAGEWDDTPALQMLCAEREVFGRILDGRGFDVGNPVGYEAAKAYAAQLDARGKR